MEFEQAHYDPSHKTTSVASTDTTISAIWDSLPSLYTGRAESVTSAYELDDLQEIDFIEEDFNKNFNHFIQTSKVNEPVTTSSDSIQPVMMIPDTTQSEVSPKFLNVPVVATPNDKILSIDQKRANHIASEQKRRNTIRGGFKELTELIPTLKNINNSKSTILFKSVDFIKQLDKRNKSLRDKLSVLQQKVKQKQQHKINKIQHVQLNYYQKNKQQLELLQEQLKLQQELLSKHNIQFDSISIPSDHHVNNHHFSSNALIIPSDVVPSFNIPADENYQYIHRERLLSSGKLNHLI